jgi:membrane protein DedA with SNARE-associated domain
MNMWPVAGALFGATTGMFIAKEFTENFFLVFPASMAGACLGIVLSFVISKRRDGDETD